MLAPDSAAPPDSPPGRLATLPGGEPELTLGWEAIRWAEKWLVQPNGPRAGLPFRMTRDQMRFLLWFYALDDDGQWIYHHGVRRLSKGSGKSPFAAVMALIEFCAPVRLAQKDDRALGGCIGKPVDMPWVQIAATAESQTHNTMRMVRAFAPKGSKVVREYGLDPGKTKYYKTPEGTLEIITSSTTAAEGAEASFVVADETEWWKPSNGGPELVATLEDNLAKSGARLLETANAWIPAQESVAEATWEAWKAQEEGRLVDEAGLILYDARIASPDVDITDYNAVEGELKWLYDDCDWKRLPDGTVDVRPILKRIFSLKSKPSESQRKYLNWPTVHENAWSDPKDWAKLVKSRPIDPTEPIVGFFDGSKSRDATAAVYCCVSDGHIFVPTVNGRPTIWEPDPSHDDDDVVPVVEIDAAIKKIAADYNLVGFFGDVHEWESFVKIEWPNVFGDQLKVSARDGTKDPQKIAWDMRSTVFDFTKAVELAEDEILNGLLTHDGNPVLARHVANARRHPNRWGVSISKESPSSPHKIDAAVCMIGARMVRRIYLSKPGKQPGHFRGLKR